MRRPILASASLAFLAAALALSCGHGYYETVMQERVKQLKAEDSDDRSKAAWALGELGARAKGALLPLSEGLKDEDPYVRLAVAEAITKIAESLGAAGEEGAAPAVPALTQALKDEDVEVRTAAADALGTIGGKEAAPALPALLEALKDEDGKVRTFAAWALGEIGPDAREADAALVAAMEDDDPDVRKSSAEALLKLRGVEIEKPKAKR